MNYFYSLYDGHRELHAICGTKYQYMCIDCASGWSDEADDWDKVSYNKQLVPDTTILLLGAELL